jgi:uncharacterized protein involved in response to NO
MHPLLSYAFRPFFLLAGLQAIVAMLLWALALHGWSWPGAPALGADWHAHAMLAGFAGAVIAGFVLTAVANWTGRPPLSGALLAALVLAWLLGRAAMLAAGALPPVAVAAADLLFPAGLAILVTREIAAAGNRRNFVICVILAAWTLLVLGFHLDRAGAWPGTRWLALLLMTHLLLLLITLIAGRIIPGFTANWLRQHRPDIALPAGHRWLELTILPLALATAISDVLAPAAILTGGLALLLATLHGLRLAGWRGAATRGEPLLLVLHAAYAALVLGYLLLALSALAPAFPRSSALHLLTVGAISGMILAMMTRVTLGHTGRPLTAGPATVLAYALLAAAALTRTASPLAASLAQPLLDLSSALWIAAFGVFLVSYAPALLLPRIPARS